MHFMMRKNYYMLHISHFGVCELREGEKENVFHFSYLSESSRNLKKIHRVQALRQINQMRSSVVVWHGCATPTIILTSYRG